MWWIIIIMMSSEACHHVCTFFCNGNAVSLPTRDGIYFSSFLNVGWPDIFLWLTEYVRNAVVWVLEPELLLVVLQHPPWNREAIVLWRSLDQRPNKGVSHQAWQLTASTKAPDTGVNPSWTTETSPITI